MPNKGDKTCCCNGCEEPPAPNLLDVTFAESVLWRTYCCACIPEFACLVVVNRSTGLYDSLIYRLFCAPAPIPFDEMPVYRPAKTNGKFKISGDPAFTVDIHFYIVDGVCNLCLLSPELEITRETEGACIPVTDAMRNAPNFFCSRLSQFDSPLDYSTDKYLGQGPEVHGVGTKLSIGDYDFYLSRADHVAITPRPNCIDAEGNQVIDESPLKDLCCNCSCICRCACLTKRSITGSSATIACLSPENSWLFPSGSTVTISSTTVNKRCVLSLFSDEGADPPPVELGGLDTKCPRPIARWSTSAPAGGGFPAHTVWYEFACSGCGDRCNIDLGGCCANERTSFPRVLNADVTTTCPACPTLSLLLVYDSFMNIWVGETMMCGHPIKLSIGCPFSSLNFQGSPCITQNPVDSTTSCDPILSSFTFTTGGIGCCGVGSFVSPTITVVVYE